MTAKVPKSPIAASVVLFLVLASSCSRELVVPHEPYLIKLNPEGPFSVWAEDLDLSVLIVLDNHPAMAERLAKLQETLPERLLALVDERSRTQLGIPHGPLEPRRVRVAVITSDMGAPFPDDPRWGQRCVDDQYGDGGHFQLAEEGCGQRASEPVLVFERGAEGLAGDPDAFVEDLRCRLAIPADGCDFTQPYEAMYAALAPNFVRDARGGRGLGCDKSEPNCAAPNAGFRDEVAATLVVHVGGGTDCSYRPDDAEYFRLAEGEDVWDAVARCEQVAAEHAEELASPPHRREFSTDGPLTSPMRYADFLHEGRIYRNYRSSFIAMTGLPAGTGSIPFGTFDTPATNVCVSEHGHTDSNERVRGDLRTLPLLAAMEVRGVYPRGSSACDVLAPDALDRLFEHETLTDVRPMCIRAGLVEDDGRIACELFETRTEESVSCASLPGRLPEEVERNADGSFVCELRQIRPGDVEVGFFTRPSRGSECESELVIPARMFPFAELSVRCEHNTRETAEAW